MTLSAILGTIIIVAVTVWLGRRLVRKVPVVPGPEDVTPKPPASHALGEAPATAFKVGDAQLVKLRGTQRCPSCRSEMTDAGDDQVRYDQRDLLVLHFVCSKCQTKRTLYVEHRA